jgi:NlpC/P60 family putative phage cell wall peptidase
MSEDTFVTPDTVLAEVRNWIGTPYRHQGHRRGVGCDCLGLVRGVWRELYGREPEAPGPYSAEWSALRVDDPLLDAARRHFVAIDPAVPGDLLVFAWKRGACATHLAILAPDDRLIHAYERSGVVSSALVPHWRRRICGTFRFPAQVRT